MSVVQSDDSLVTHEKYTVRNAKGEILPPGTFFVIRKSDMFSVPGLWSYTHALATVLDLAADRPILTPEEEENLRNTMDRASALATVWQEAKTGKLPD